MCLKKIKFIVKTNPEDIIEKHQTLNKELQMSYKFGVFFSLPTQCMMPFEK